jgi:membrane protein DedA with SNARE-associated domain
MSSLHDVHQLILLHGDVFYLITFLWTALEGETFVIFAGFAAQKGMLNPWFLFMAAWMGSFCGDQIFFLTGRRYGIRILNHLPKLKPSVDRSLGWLERHAAAFILAYRFMYGIRNISGVAIGMSHLPWQKFMIWNAVAAFVWAATFTGFGFLFGDVIEHLPHKHKSEVVQESVRQVMLAVLGLFLLIVAFRLIVIKCQKRRKE